MRKITHISVHCSASDYDYHDNVESIYEWHVVENEWSDIGYHYIITKNGDIHTCRPIERTPAGVKGHNEEMIAIMLTGKYKFSTAQFKSLRRLINTLKFEYDIAPAGVKGHNEYNGHHNRKCPNFDLKNVLASTVGIHQNY